MQERITIEIAESALAHIDSHDRDIWVQMGMAIKSEFGEAGFDIWDAWSARAENYNAKDARIVWKSFKQGGGVKIGSLLFAAKQSGWTWNNHPGTMPDAEYAKLRKRVHAERVAEEKRKEERQKKAADRAMEMFQTAKAGKGHPYMISKGLEDETVLVSPDGDMVVPMMLSPGQLSAVQLIDSEGNKKFQPWGCRVSGTFFSIGNIMRPKYIWLCEGVATGYTMLKVLRDTFKRSDDAVVICFSGSNMKKVGEKFKREKSEGFTQIKDVYVVADNDAPICPNTGKNITKIEKDIHHAKNFRCPECGEEHSWCYSYGLKIARDLKLSYIYCMNHGRDMNDVYQESQQIITSRQNLYLSEFFETMAHKTTRRLDEGYAMQPLVSGPVGSLHVGMIKYYLPS